MPRNRVEKVPGPDSALVHPDARERLERAAEAAGLTLAQLADLMVDSGALSVPPAKTPDGLVATMTVRDLGHRLFQEIQAVSRDERADWFEKLLDAQRVALVVALHDRGFRPEVISRELGRPSQEIRAWIDSYADRVGMQVTQLRLSTIAGHVMLAAEKAMQGLEAENDWKGYFSIQEKLVKILQSLGIVDQAIHRVEVTHRHEDNRQAEIEQILEIERKKQKRLLEIQMADQQEFDQVPKLEFETEE